MNDDDKSLCERLEQVEGHTTHYYRNPDGPEAARRIRELNAEMGRLRENWRCAEQMQMEAQDALNAANAEIKLLRAQLREEAIAELIQLGQEFDRHD